MAAANQVAFDLSRARMKAIGENVYTQVSFGTAVSSQFGYGAGYEIRKSSDGLIYTSEASRAGEPLPSDVVLYAFPSQVTFNRQGMASAPVTLWLRNSLYQWRLVTMNSVGRVRVQ